MPGHTTCTVRASSESGVSSLQPKHWGPASHLPSGPQPGPKVSTPANLPWLTGPRAPCPAGPALSVLSTGGWPCGWCGAGREESERVIAG